MGDEDKSTEDLDKQLSDARDESYASGESAKEEEMTKTALDAGFESYDAMMEAAVSAKERISSMETNSQKKVQEAGDKIKQMEDRMSELEKKSNDPESDKMSDEPEKKTEEQVAEEAKKQEEVDAANLLDGMTEDEAKGIADWLEGETELTARLNSEGDTAMAPILKEYRASVKAPKSALELLNQRRSGQKSQSTDDPKSTASMINNLLKKKTDNQGSAQSSQGHTPTIDNGKAFQSAGRSDGGMIGLKRVVADN